MDGEQSSQTNYEEIEGLDEESWGDYPLDDILIRTESRTIFEVIRRIDDSGYVMDPDFQRDFIWDESKQSKLIESVIMRIPLPVFYLAEDQHRAHDSRGWIAATLHIPTFRQKQTPLETS